MTQKTTTSTISEKNINNTKLDKIKPNTTNLKDKNSMHNNKSSSQKHYRLHSTSINNNTGPQVEKNSTSDKNRLTRIYKKYIDPKKKNTSNM